MPSASKFSSLPAFLAVVLLTPSAHAEIQVLFRGDSYTEPEAAEKLAGMAAEFNSGDEWNARAEKIRQGVRRGMRLEQLPPPGPLNPIRHTVRQGDGYTVENVAIETLPGFWLTGNLYLPETIDGETAGILCTHGHAANGRLAEYTQTRCAAIARMGAVVFAYDMVGYGESQPVPHHHAETMRLQTYNSMRALDFLLSLGSVDEDRLAVTGESGGGTQSFLLSCLDDRIDVSVPVVQVSAHFYGGCICESGLPIHKSADHETNNVEIAASFAPKPQLLISDGGDWTRNVDRVEFPYVRRVYELCGAKDQVENAHFADENHDYGPSKRAAMYRFVAKHLGLDLTRVQNDAGEIDESFFEARKPEELHVFTAEHPRPDDALTDAEVVIGRLDRHE